MLWSTETLIDYKLSKLCKKIKLTDKTIPGFQNKTLIYCTLRKNDIKSKKLYGNGVPFLVSAWDKDNVIL